jgi:hypothetical protein
MAQGIESETDVVRRESAQPRVGRPKSSDLTASPDAAKAAADASAQPTADHVAMVSRDTNGDPAQSRNFRVMVDDDAPDHVKDAAWNKAGEAQGAERVNWDERLTGPDYGDRDEQLRDENAAIARASYNPAGLYEGKKG